MSQKLKPIFQISFEVLKSLSEEKVEAWEDKVVMGIARATLDITNVGHHFPYLTGELNRASMSEGVVKITNKTYGLGARGVEYAPKVWNYGQGTKWTNPNTYPQWYTTTYNKQRDSILEYALRGAEGELE